MTTKKKKATKKAVKKTVKKKNASSLAAFILLDRSGSMGMKWTETLSSVNAYISGLAKGKVKGHVTVALFDEHVGSQFDIIRDAVDSDKCKLITPTEASPRGGTPLYDALSKIVNLAKQAAERKTVIVVMTDGQENASREVSREDAMAKVAECKGKGWEVLFLGADFDAVTQGSSLGLTRSKGINMTVGNYADTMDLLSQKTMCYASSVSGSISFDAKDRAIASKKNP